jgi:hypothetical protein
MQRDLGALDGLLDLLVGVLVRDIEAESPNEKPAAPGRALLRVKDSTCRTIPENHPAAT